MLKAASINFYNKANDLNISNKEYIYSLILLWNLRYKFPFSTVEKYISEWVFTIMLKTTKNALKI